MCRWRGGGGARPRFVRQGALDWFEGREDRSAGSLGCDARLVYPRARLDSVFVLESSLASLELLGLAGQFFLP